MMGPGADGSEVYRREQLQPGDFFSGPAIVRQNDCTTCLVEGFDVEVDRHGNISSFRQEGERVEIDNVTLEILKNHSRAAAESMAYTLYRTAHSTFVKETEDFTTGLTTPDWRNLRDTDRVGCNVVRRPELRSRRSEPSSTTKTATSA